MVFSKKLLGKGEHVLVHLRRQGSELLPNTVAFIIVLITAVMLAIFLPSSWRPLSVWIILAVFAIATIPIIILPWWRWRTTTYTITNKRIVTSMGTWTKQGHDIPLATVKSVQYHLLSEETTYTTGELILETRDAHSLTLKDVPSIEKVYKLINDVIQARQGQAPVIITTSPTSQEAIQQ